MNKSICAWIGIGVVAATFGCKQKPATETGTAPVPVPLEYTEFECDPHPTFNVVTGEPVGPDGPYPTTFLVWEHAGVTHTNNVLNEVDVLNVMAQIGWKFTWTDGKKFLLSRPASIKDDFRFDVTKNEVIVYSGPMITGRARFARDIAADAENAK